MHISGSLTMMIRTFGLISFPKSIGIVNHFLKSLCRFSVCFSKFTTKAMNPKIVIEVDVIRMCFIFFFLHQILFHSLIHFPVLSPFACYCDV